ncbi:hypothetical protein LPTSP4_03140 [Leptospira ryugenii]|uniref:LmbE family protein n=1 Tax=Leptospira ryugenii TaxID=1917863 RepID=A0A2P2DW07_9LEPT|nr:PIG-L family deacetylase [Leptospira ryugenii]GBF48814.1 hypothetical protein LPTSP4_03140 [Leptospira ryugenii]
MKSLLVVSPHPDDETLGAGGTLLKMKSQGKPIYWLNITNASIEYGWPKDFVEKRQKEIQEVVDQYNFDGWESLDLKPVELDQYPTSTIVSKISEKIKLWEPESIAIPWKDDPHSDHKIVYNALISATKSFRYPFIKRVMAMEILSETNFSDEDSFSANYFHDISGFLEKKIEIMNLFKSEMGIHPFPRSEDAIRSLAILRGSQCGFRYAEAFKILKLIED